MFERKWRREATELRGGVAAVWPPPVYVGVCPPRGAPHLRPRPLREREDTEARGGRHRWAEATPIPRKDGTGVERAGALEPARLAGGKHAHPASDVVLYGRVPPARRISRTPASRVGTRLARAPMGRGAAEAARRTALHWGEGWPGAQRRGRGGALRDGALATCP